MKSLLLWCVFVAGGTAVVLAYPILSLRYPKAMAGRANTAINVFGFIGMFIGQWGIGLVLDLWPPTERGYAARGLRLGARHGAGRCSSPAWRGCGAAASCSRREAVTSA